MILHTTPYDIGYDHGASWFPFDVKSHEEQDAYYATLGKQQKAEYCQGKDDGYGGKVRQDIIERELQRQQSILRIMTVFPMATYNAHPIYEQFVPFVNEVSKYYTYDELYRVFAMGAIPAQIDTIVQKYVKHWRPVGETVESRIEQKRIG